jgi:tetratricopeptide (TPR) repeat protein
MSPTDKLRSLLRHRQTVLQGLAALAALATIVITHAADESRPIPLSRGLGKLHHPVTTTNEIAQHYFNQGLTLVFAFNHDAAVRSFNRALQYDPNLAMAHWGIGLSLGPNINLPVSPEAEKAAFEATARASALSARATEAERDYIQALTRRYSTNAGADLKQLDIDFKNAMRALMQKYPDDLDAATLFAESMMDLKPWQLWDSSGEPADGTMEIVEVLESVLRRDPSHPGANHYYIHAVEASPFPERALPSAQRLESYAPAAGHLVHMPAHVYIRVGDYAAAARQNEVAAEADLDYIQACAISGVYPAMYTSHNFHFAAISHTLQGRYAPARRYAERLNLHVKPIVAQIPDTEAFLPTLEQVLVAFRRWNEILMLPKPEATLKLHTPIWHFARGSALAATGKLPEAQSELNQLDQLRAAIPAEALFGPFNTASNIFAVASLQLSARIDAANGDFPRAIRIMEKALAIEDVLRYNEPPDWYLYGREALGGLLLTTGDAPGAERVFREDLRRNQRKGRSLYGLRAALIAQNKSVAGDMVGGAFETAWENADVTLEPADIWLYPVRESGAR